MMQTTGTIRRKVTLGAVILWVALCLSGPGLLAAPGSAVETSKQVRFVDKGDGTVLDRQTGLMWFKNGQSTLGAIPWEEAGTFCNGLKFAGYTDWRLPTKDELVTIVDTRNQSPALPLKSPFENVVTFLDYWTETDHKYGPGYAWAINLYYGKKKFLGKKKYAFAWPVRPTPGAFDNLGTPARPGPEIDRWLSLKTKYARINYLEPASLQALARALGTLSVGSKTAAATIGPLLDQLFREVQTLLDMRTASARFSLTVYTDQQQMQAALKDTLGEGQQRRAWYNHKQRTIFVSADQLSEDVLAHEMAMAVIYQYMKVPPPRTTAKILAAYVDSQRKSYARRRQDPVK